MDRLLIGQYVTMFGDVISHVNITAVKSEDGGGYECTAVSKAGSASHYGRLNIYGNAIKHERLLNFHFFFIVVGQLSFFFSVCHRRTNHEIFCKIKLFFFVHVGSPYVRPMEPISAIAGKSLTIKCPAAGYPLDTITWEKENVRLPTNM